MKLQGHQLAAFKPTSIHWTSFTNEVSKQQVFTHLLQLGAQQALWQFGNCLPMINVDESTQAAKENAVFSLIYINFIRLVLGQMIKDTRTPILSLEFLTKLAKIDDAEAMSHLVSSEFTPLVNSPSKPGLTFPPFGQVYDAASQLIKFMFKRKVICIQKNQFFQMKSFVTIYKKILK